MQSLRRTSVQHSIGSNLNERLLRQANAGSSRALSDLADTYSYGPNDLRPLKIVLPFLRDQPPSRGSQEEHVTFRLASDRLACIAVLDNVGSAASWNSNTTTQFISAIGKDWSSIFAWCDYLSHYAESLPPQLACDLVLGLGHFLFLFAMPAVSVTALPDCSPPIDLAFRLWDGGYNHGRLADVSTGGTPGIATLFANWLLGDEDVGQIIIDRLLQGGSHAKLFFKSLKRRFVALGHRIHRKEVDLGSAKKIFLMLAAIMTRTSEAGGGAVDSIILKNGALVAFSECLTQLVCTGLNGEIGSGSAIIGLMHLYEILDWVTDSSDHFLIRLEQLVEGGMVQVMHAALVDHSPGTLEHDMACSLIVFLTQYLPYPSIVCATGRSLQAIVYRAMPWPNYFWDGFAESVVRSTVTVTDGGESVKHSCDNLQGHLSDHGLSVTGQDWEHLHREECPRIRAAVRDRKSRGEWIPLGSKGILAAMLFQIYCDRRSHHAEDIRAFAGSAPHDLVTTFDFRYSVEPFVTLRTKAEYLMGIQHCRRQASFPRVQAMVGGTVDPCIRMAEAIYPHNEESIRIIARISGSPQTGFSFIHGAWLTCP
ncbi:hypothetical protein NMY22_g15800 [Coprinellus aureogranulatus]|nr:hypothetical protein NMY22_g15800 [Coprinellus aureogranulatus]